MLQFVMTIVGWFLGLGDTFFAGVSGGVTDWFNS